jgi:hypothetical protein
MVQKLMVIVSTQVMVKQLFTIFFKDCYLHMPYSISLNIIVSITCQEELIGKFFLPDQLMKLQLKQM